MTPDPPLRPDHHCHQCQEPLPERAVLHGDGFCSATCCRAFHNNPLPAYKNGMHYGSNWRNHDEYTA